MELKDKTNNEVKDLNLVYEPVEIVEKLNLNIEVENFEELVEKSTKELNNSLEEDS